MISETYLFTTDEVTCTGGGGGGGSSPTPQIHNPCDSVNKLAANAVFKSKLDSLKSKTTGNREYHYYYRNTTSNTLDATSGFGNLNELNVNYDLPSFKVDGVMHNHFFQEGKSLSIFSGDDIYELIHYYTANRISDPYTFSYVVATQDGTQYMLKIDNLDFFDKFTDFYSDRNNWNIMQQLNPILPDRTGHNFVAQNELNFLRILQLSKSGLKLFKANSTSTSWNPIKHSNFQVVADPCN